MFNFELQRLRDGEFENTLVDVQGFKLKNDLNDVFNKGSKNLQTLNLGNVFAAPSQNTDTGERKMPVSEAR